MPLHRVTYPDGLQHEQHGLHLRHTVVWPSRHRKVKDFSGWEVVVLRCHQQAAPQKSAQLGFLQQPDRGRAICWQFLQVVGTFGARRIAEHDNLPTAGKRASGGGA
jgi:hypothetical protein